MSEVKIGLALGAGAAKGWSHIGVINGLKRLGVEVDIIAGCSIGALVGAAYATRRLTAMEAWVRSFSYWDVLRMMDLSWQRGGLLRGERVFKAVRQLIGGERISDCRIRFGAVATNLSTGRELWFTEGDLHRAIRASCSMPGLLSPVLFNDYWLVDGAVVNPVPISLARALGADVVIAVDLQHDAHLMQGNLLMTQPNSEERDSLRARVRTKMASRKSQSAPTAMDIMATSIQVLENRLKRSRMAGDPADILLQPFCPQISMLDFHRAGESIEAGELAVEKQRDALLSWLKK